ncbi:MAG: putative iron-dependent repressor [Myxococcaceae bacterium]|nr:putative iron-dependent repressor [Myxococcaceae bacterium]
MNCSYCNADFDAEAAKHACSACLISTGCKSVKCPRCGYDSPEEPQLFARLKAWWGRGAEAAAEALPRECTLSQLRPGESALITALRPGSRKDLQKLLALGVLPGSTVTLERNFPSFVFRVGFSQYATDRMLSDAVVVRRSVVAVPAPAAGEPAPLQPAAL